MGINKDRRVVVVINGVNEGTWDKAGEFKTTAQSKEYFPGGGRNVPPIDLGGTAKHAPVVLERGLDTGVADGKVLQWRRMVGRRVPITATDHILDADGNVVGQGETATGIILGAWKSGADNENEDETMVGIEMSVLDIG